MVIVVITFDGCVFDGPVHPFDLPIGPGVPYFCEPVFDPVFLATHIKHVGHVCCRWSVLVTRRKGWLYLAIVLDLYSRRIVGWQTSDRLKRDLAITALKRAIATRYITPIQALFQNLGRDVRLTFA